MKLPLILGVTGQTGRYLLCELIESLTIISVCNAGQCVTPVVDLPAQVGPSCASYLHGFGSTGFKIPTLSNGLEESHNSIIIHKLHDILRPFLL